MPQSLLTGQQKEKPTYRVWCLNSSFVHGRSSLNKKNLRIHWERRKIFQDFSKFSLSLNYAEPALRIHDILVWIRIRGSMPLTNGSGSFYFHHWHSRCRQKTNFKKVFLHITFWRYFYIIFRSEVKKKSQNSRNQGFSSYLCLMIEGSEAESGSIPMTNRSGSGSRRPKTRGSGGSGSPTLL